MDSTTVTAAPGGAFLLGPGEAAFSLEDLSDEQRQSYQTAMRFLDEEVLPAVDEYETKPPGLGRKLLRQCGELGLLSMLTPEKYGGLEMDLTSQLLVAEAMGRYSSFSVTYGAHSGIGTLPLALFGTEQQKERYLPRLASGEWMAAYCLSEPQAGSDALACRTRAELSADGSHYTLNGQKMWISNGGWADFFTVFAKVDGEKFTAFLVEKSYEGVRPGAEERKMGIHGSSTTAIYLDNVRVPVENVLGEIGRGHIIAFNILNLGRLKLGASCAGGAKQTISEAVAYAKQRVAFGQPIANFGAIRHKLAEMAVKTFVTESIVYRTGGLIDALWSQVSWADADAAPRMLAALEEYAVECAVAKVVGSEAMDFVADEAVQIHGGYGYHQDYAVERLYRDSRINRIFEGTNEINRLLTVSMLLKRAGQGRLPLMGAVTELMGRIMQGDFSSPRTEGPLRRERDIVERVRKVTVLSMGLAYQRFGRSLEQEQEINLLLAEMILTLYGMDSAVLRAGKLMAAGREEPAASLARVIAEDGLAATARAAEVVLAASVEGGKLEEYSGVLRRLARLQPADTIGPRRTIAARLLEAGRYVV
ncbi:MAG: acyl-CoA dehydrogenase [Acidobacteria bacterium]|nr:acyl-CoA dehydrogenase [Acidobacteriota bacterium]